MCRHKKGTNASVKGSPAASLEPEQPQLILQGLKFCVAEFLILMVPP